SGGRAAIGDANNEARPGARILWARETEAHSFDTPERRPAPEGRGDEITATIADESVRRYYRQDFSARLSQFFAPARNQRREPSCGNCRGPRARGEWRARGH